MFRDLFLSLHLTKCHFYTVNCSSFVNTVFGMCDFCEKLEILIFVFITYHEQN